MLATVECQLVRRIEWRGTAYAKETVILIFKKKRTPKNRPVDQWINEPHVLEGLDYYRLCI